ncbi:MAG: hypothetical protein K0S91_89 [Nitrososphaeraceae archaeon]|jgi:hypothetical protein|nr:hypothetical protein [Nitrososphaeraceae archaeon]
MQVIAIPFLLCFIIFVSSFSCIYSASSVYAAGTEQEAYTKVNQINPSYIAATNGYLIKQLGNFEFTVDLDANQIFPNEKIKQDMVSKYKSAKYNIANLEYELIGFKIIASDIKIHANPTKIDQTQTRIDIPLMLAKNVKVSNGIIDLDFNEIDLGSIYAIYNENIDKITVHVPMDVAYRYLQQ